MARKQKTTGGAEESAGLTVATNRGQETEQGNGGVNQGSGERTGDSQIEDADIAARAYQIYEREGRSDGRDLEHWLQAESELRSERQGRGAQPGSQASQHTAPRSARLQQEQQDGAGRPTAAQSGLQSGMSGAR